MPSTTTSRSTATPSASSTNTSVSDAPTLHQSVSLGHQSRTSTSPLLGDIRLSAPTHAAVSGTDRSATGPTAPNSTPGPGRPERARDATRQSPGPVRKEHQAEHRDTDVEAALPKGTRKVQPDAGDLHVAERLDAAATTAPSFKETGNGSGLPRKSRQAQTARRA